MIHFATPDGNKKKKITLEEFINLYNQSRAILLDIRMPFETAIYKIPFALHIPANELEKNLDKLPKDKIIVVACPTQNRSPFAAMFLREKGFEARYLENGLIGLISYLKGNEAKKLKVK
jgi:rhodanese-related sulfurtransferase